MAVVPLGLLARATRTVSFGITEPQRGWTHISILRGREGATVPPAVTTEPLVPAVAATKG